jgi:hypothetical protein
MPKPFLLRIESDEICQGLDVPDTEVTSVLQTHEDSLQRITRNKDLIREMTAIFCYLRRLSKFLDSCTQSTPNPEQVDLAEFLENVETRTIRLLHTLDVDFGHPFRWLMISFGLAANIYIHAILREIPLTVPYYAVFAIRLWDAVQNIDFAALDSNVVKKMLWIVFVGRLAAHGRPE